MLAVLANASSCFATQTSGRKSVRISIIVGAAAEDYAEKKCLGQRRDVLIIGHCGASDSADASGGNKPNKKYGNRSAETVQRSHM